MKQSSWPDVIAINQKNYYTCVALPLDPSLSSPAAASSTLT